MAGIDSCEQLESVQQNVGDIRNKEAITLVVRGVKVEITMYDLLRGTCKETYKLLIHFLKESSSIFLRASVQIPTPIR